MRSEELDKKIKEAADQHHPAYDDKAWDKMLKLLDQHMPQKDNNRRRFILLLFFFLFLAGGSFILISKPWDNKIASQQPGDTSLNTTKPKTQQDKSDISILNKSTDQPIVREIENDKTTSNTDKTEDAIKNNEPPLAITNNRSTNSNPRKQLNNNEPAVAQKNILSNQSPGEKILSESVNKKIEEVIVKKQPDISFENKPEELKKEEVVKTGSETGLTKNQPVNKGKKISGEEKKVDAADPQENNEGTKAKSTNKPARKQALSGFGFSVSTGIDASKSGNGEIGKASVLYGAGISYTFKKFTLKTGVYAAEKIYTAPAKDYTLSYQLPSTVKFIEADAYCDVIEIPLTINYQFGVSRKHSWFAGAGLSSYFMKKEEYDYLYKTATSEYYHSKTYRNENQHYFSALGLSAGYTRQLNKTISISAEPYLKIPLTGIGAGKVKLASGGILLSAGIRPFGKNKKSERK